MRRLRQLAKLKKQYGYKLMIDSHCSPEIIEELAAKGVDGFVLGTGALFGKQRPHAELIQELHV